MEVYVKETLYVIDYNNDIPEAELRNAIFISDDHMTPGYAYNITIKEANTGYSDLTFSMPNMIINDEGQQAHNPKLDLLVPLVKIRYHRQVFYAGEKEIVVREPVDYGDKPVYEDKIYSPEYPNNIIEDYIMDYVVQPVDRKRNVLEIATNFTAMDYPRFTLSKKKVGLLIDDFTTTKPEWSIVNPGAPMTREGEIIYIPWDTTYAAKVIPRPAGMPEEEYQAILRASCEWDPMEATNYPLTQEQVERLERDPACWEYGFDATCFYWPIKRTGRFKGILYQEGGWIGFQGYDLLGLEPAGLDPDLHIENRAWHWTQIYPMLNYLQPNNPENYLRHILDGTAWKVGYVDKPRIQNYNPKDGLPLPEEDELRKWVPVSNSNCYNAITAVCQNFQLYPIFDCLTRTVSLRIHSGKNYGLVYRIGNNIKTDTNKLDGEKVITKLYVSGGSDDVGTANINIGPAVRAVFQDFQGFYQYYDPNETSINQNNLASAETHRGWAVVDDSLTNFQVSEYQLKYYEEGTIPDKQTMPAASAEELDKAYRYIGETTETFIQNHCYKCIKDIEPESELIRYKWEDVTGLPFLKEIEANTHGLRTPEYWEAGDNRQVYFWDADNQSWVLGQEEDGIWVYGDYRVDPSTGTAAPWDPNDPAYIISRSPYGTNYILNFKWYYDNGWMSKEQILALYQYNLEINDLNKTFADKYNQDWNATRTLYDTVKNNYDLAEKEFRATLNHMENKYYRVDGDYSQGYGFCWHTCPQHVFPGQDEFGNDTYFIEIFHCYECHETIVKKESGQIWSTCPICGGTDVENNKIETPLFDPEKYISEETAYPYGTDITHLYGDGYVGGYKYNPQQKGSYLNLVLALDRADDRDGDKWKVEDYEQHISIADKIQMKKYQREEGGDFFDEYNYVLEDKDGNEIYIRSTAGQIEVWNKDITTYRVRYGDSLEYLRQVDAAIKRMEELEKVFDDWQAIENEIYQKMQDEFGDFLVEGNYQNTDQPSVPILFNEGLEASRKYSIPEVTYDLDVVASSGLIEYRRPTVTRYVCGQCGHVYYEEEPEECIVCGDTHFSMEHDVYNDLVQMLHSVGQVVPKAGDYVRVYDKYMGFKGTPGLITEIDRYLDNAIKNTIRVDTSYTDEEQLVGNIINATNTVLSNKDIYARTAILNGDGTIDSNAITETLNTSGADIAINSTNGSILLNGSGLRCIDPANPNNAIKYTGTGIYKTTNLNNENGEGEAVFWERMMTPDGINATYINSGVIDTNRINIMAGAGSRVVMDKFGLYVKGSTNASAHITEFDVDQAKQDANYAEDWGNKNNIATFVGIDNQNNPLIYTRGYLVANEGSNIAGWITDKNSFYHLGNTRYQCPECGFVSTSRFSTCPNCSQTVTPNTTNKDLWLSPEGLSWSVNKHRGTFAFFSNDNFGVDTDGKLYATNATIEGDITVTDGSIAGFEIHNTQMYGPKAGLSGDNGNGNWAFWAGADEAHKDTAPFRVGFDGHLYATDATIGGTIDAEHGTVGGWAIDPEKLYSVDGRGKIDGGAIAGTSFNNTYFKIDGNGYLYYYNNPGYLTCGHASVHPWLSAVNVNYANGISFRNGGTWSNAGAEVDYIRHEGSSFRIGSGGNMNLSGTNIAIDSNQSTSNYVRINELYSCSNGSNYWLAFGKTASNSPARIRSNGTDLCLFYGSGGAVYAGSTGPDYKVKTAGATPSSRNVKTNLTSLEDEYDILYEEMKSVEAYNYDYKYKNVNGNLTSDYGFIIDEIEDTKHLSKYFREYESQRIIRDDTLYPIDEEEDRRPNESIIDIKVWDTDSYIKGLFVMIKTLQHKIDELEMEIKKEKTN